MNVKALLRSRIKAERKRGAHWVKLLDLARLAVTAEGRGLLWTRAAHPDEVHQTTPYTCEERYPALFDLAAALVPHAKRILSFGCSTGEELSALRRRFPDAEIIGVEINPRSRRIAARRMKNDPTAAVRHPRAIDGKFDVIFALAVLQREPHRIDELGIADLSPYYPFARFNAAVGQLFDLLVTGGLLCVTNAQYRIEDSGKAQQLDPIAASPLMEEPLFGADGRQLPIANAHTIFRKRAGGDPQ